MQLPRAKEKELRALQSPHGRKKSDLLLVEGVRAIGTMLDCGKQADYFVCAPGHFSRTGKDFLARLESLGTPLYECDSKQFAALAETEHSQGFLAVTSRAELLAAGTQGLENARLIVYLDGISDPGNLGTIIRTAAAFGVDLLALSPDSADYGNPKVVRASAGTIFALPLLPVDDPDTFFAHIESKRMELIAADSAAETSLEDLQIRESACIVLGAEATGLSRQVLAHNPRLFRIPLARQVESLNVAAAAAIAINRVAERMKLI